jgi:hypothetical protein
MNDAYISTLRLVLDYMRVRSRPEQLPDLARRRARDTALSRNGG